ncbi:hypothetical protein [Hugenholtzia roseola]|uniref:hypothetical protein n=1 Tax=Hugenholtzia roseola TaxID=1002 RepID=UPI00040B21B8|nr:hypothetical protein [Hugenholtzia roseola]
MHLFSFSARIFCFCLLAGSLFFLPACKAQKNSEKEDSKKVLKNELDTKMTSLLETTWVRSHEDDLQTEEGAAQAFRAEGYDFPPSRGRESFRLAQNGEVQAKRIAPTDGLAEWAGRWQQATDTQVFTLDFAPLQGGQKQVWRFKVWKQDENGVLYLMFLQD